MNKFILVKNLMMNFFNIPLNCMKNGLEQVINLYLNYQILEEIKKKNNKILINNNNK